MTKPDNMILPFKELSQINLGIIGCGNIGTEIALFADSQPGFRLDCLCDTDTVKSHQLAAQLRNNHPDFVEIAELVNRCNLLVEAANKNVVKEILENLDLCRANKQVLFLSSGGLFENVQLMDSLSRHELSVPSGAIAGIDALRAVAGHIEELQLTTTKPMSSLPPVKQEASDSSVTLFDGAIKEAIELFPQNINVAATIFLATRFNGLKIKIVADREATQNQHEIYCRGSFGEIRTTTINKPSKNPKTSYLAILSAIGCLKQLLSAHEVKNAYVG